MEASFEFPTAGANDASDVAVALETAQALWRRGDSREALRWLRRAAEGAESEGDDLRAVALARAAADLQDRLPPSNSVPAPAPSRPPPMSRQPPPMTPAAAPAQPPVRASAPPPPSQNAIANTGGLEPWTPPTSRPSAAPERSSPRSSGPPPLPPSELTSAPKHSRPAPPPPEPEPRTPETPRAPAAAVNALAEQTTSEPRREPGARPGTFPAIRVSVELLSKKSGTLLVRLLGEEDEPAGNAHEALLVPLDPSVDFRDL